MPISRGAGLRLLGGVITGIEAGSWCSWSGEPLDEGRAGVEEDPWEMTSVTGTW